MELQRTANAGVLIKLDGIAILLDGLCEGIEGYLPTPGSVIQSLLDSPPDLLAFTHSHPDHCSRALLLPYKTQKLRPILGPESLPIEAVRVGEVTVTAVETRHLGKTEPGLQHHSYVIEGSKCIWFMGDAAPTEMKKLASFPRPDVLIAPYAYANTPAAWETTRRLCSGAVVIIHLPEKEKDTYGLWQQVKLVTDGGNRPFIPEIGELVRC